MSSQAYAVNLVLNGSFEDDMPGVGSSPPTNWTVVGSADLVKTQGGIEGARFSDSLDGIAAQDGDNVFQLQDGNNPRSSGLISDIFTVTTGGDFNLSAFYANRLNNTNAADAFTLDLLDLDGAIITPDTFLDPALAPFEYVEFTRTYEGLAPGDYQVTFSATAPNRTNLLQGTVDNITFEVIPEPSSLALVGLGAMGLLVRRRK